MVQYFLIITVVVMSNFYTQIYELVTIESKYYFL